MEDVSFDENKSKRRNELKKMTKSKGKRKLNEEEVEEEEQEQLIRRKRVRERAQYDEISCSLAIAVYKSKHILNLKSYCSDYYKPKMIVKTYELSYLLMPDKTEWTALKEVLEEIVLPSRYRTPPGRPRKIRIKDKSETLRSSTNCCGKCGREGHNHRNCNYFPKEQ